MKNKNTSNHEYPSVTDRVKAIVADWGIILVFIFIITFIFSLFEKVPDNARFFAFIFIFCLYDPIFTSLFGGTIGHMMNGIRVRKENNENENITFLSAIVRFAIKITLGGISLLTVTGNKKRKAIHDFAVQSVVICYNQNNKNER
jgi:uncharacterized RDD family membrane protein YckC